MWERLTSFQNLLLAFKQAARGRRARPSVADFELHLETALPELRNELVEGRYRPGRYVSFTIHDPKKRLISAAPFRDRIVHHALCNVIEPIFEPKFIFDTYANRLQKGSHKALDRCSYFMRRFEFVLPMDVKQFFPSIDHQVLLEYLAKNIYDPRTMHLCQQIIDTGVGVLRDEYEMVYFPGDTLFSIQRPRGLPIGNLTSQFLANVYLNPLDHFIKRDLKCKGYVRYVDDMLLFSNDKQELLNWRGKVLEFLSGCRLTVHENSAQTRPTRIGVPFLGFQVFLDHRRLKRRKVTYARRRLKILARQFADGEIDQKKVRASIQAWTAHAMHGDTWQLRRAMHAKIRFVTPGDQSNATKTIANF